MESVRRAKIRRTPAERGRSPLREDTVRSLGLSLQSPSSVQGYREYARIALEVAVGRQNAKPAAVPDRAQEEIRVGSLNPA